jgi:Rad3-related DNA helicase
MNRIDSIIGAWKEHKGIVHALSYRRAREIYQRSKHRDILLIHGTGQTRECVEQFLASDPPSVLLSPSVEEGFDFSGDSARWQVIPKVPFIDTRSPLIQARLNEDKSYGDYLTGQRIVQTVGRIVRSRNDWGFSFITESHWEWFQRKVKFAKWFKAAWRWEKAVPPAPKF